MAAGEERGRLRDVLSDVHLWLGVAVGVAGALAAVVAYGGPIIRAPRVAARADTTSQQALAVANTATASIQQLGRTFRLVLCTDAAYRGSLSQQSRSELRCWEFDGRTQHG